MPTIHQLKQLNERLRTYRSRYLRKRYEDLDESGTRLLVNNLLTEILGYTELEEVKTEFRIRGEYADYIIQLGRKKHFVVEVKSVQLDLTAKHLRQSVNYAANEGIDWIILTNGRVIALYHVTFNKPIESFCIFSIDLADAAQFRKAAKHLVYLTKKSVEKGELEEYRKRYQALETIEVAKLLYSSEIVRQLRRLIRLRTGILFAEEEVVGAVQSVLQSSVNLSRPKLTSPAKSIR
jgi:hypothetical protein